MVWVCLHQPQITSLWYSCISNWLLVIYTRVATDPEYPCLTNSCYPADNASQVTPELNFSLMANAMLVDNGAHLAFHDILLSDFAHVAMYQYTTAQPYINQGVGWPLWPTVAMAPDSQVRTTEAGG